MQHLPAIRPAPRNMQPRIAALVYQLVEIEPAALQQSEQRGIGGRAPHGDIRRLAVHMPGTGRPAHRCIQCRRTVAAVHHDRPAPRFSKRVEQMADKVMQRRYGLRRGRIVIFIASY